MIIVNGVVFKERLILLNEHVLIDTENNDTCVCTRPVLPSGIVIACVCVYMCVRLSVCPSVMSLSMHEFINRSS